ncbi:hypothetical protein LguiA_010092 [Lonicera macranthoides]
MDLSALNTVDGSSMALMGKAAVVHTSINHSDKVVMCCGLQPGEKALEVFEDESKVIICYWDDKNGEIICEGYDQGPRLLIHQRFPTFTSNPAYITMPVN